MANEPIQKHVIRKIRQLQAEKQQILRLPPEQALDRILNAPEPAALVHSISEQDFYHLIHDIGPEDALPIIGLASARQWEFIFDMDIWQRDRMDTAATAEWMERLQRADPQRSVAWLVEKKTDMLEFFLFKNIDVRIREHDQDPGEFGDGFFSLDNVFYVRPHRFELPVAAEGDLNGEAVTDPTRDFVEKLIKAVATYDYVAYQRILLEAAALIPAETEEDVYRLRCVRLAEKGFVPFDEAVSIYLPLSAEQLLRKKPKFIPPEPDPEAMALVPAAPNVNLGADNLFARALAQIDSAGVLQHLQGEFASLCNQLVVADQKKIQGKDDLQPIVKKAGGYLSIGLQALVPGDGLVGAMADMLVRCPLVGIFQVGFRQALALKWRTEKWVTQSWFAATGLPLTFWGETWLGVLGGLLLKKPLYFDNYQSGQMYRDFFSSRDIDVTSDCLEQIIAFDRLLAEQQVDIGPFRPYRYLTYKNLLLTRWARHERGLKADGGPIPMTEFQLFFESLWTAGPPERTIRSERKTDFLRWLSEKSGQSMEALSERHAQALEDLFAEIEDEFAPIRTENLDRRFIYLFLLDN
jgi:hypothetical protein